MLQLLLLLLLLLATHLDTGMNGLKLLLGMPNLVPQLTDLPQATMDRVSVPLIGLVDYGPHSGCSLLRLQLLEDFQDVTYAEQLVGILEKLWLVRWEVRG